LTVYEDGAIEAECGPIPCGESGVQCLEDQSACKAETPFSGMQWAKNGQSLVLRCCSINVDNKIYVGTDLVTLGSFFSGGVVEKKDMYGNGNSGIEYDFVGNVRTEQGGLRIWVYRMICDSQRPDIEKQQQVTDDRRKMDDRRNYMSHLNKQISENNDDLSDSVAQNPLQFRPHETSQIRT